MCISACAAAPAAHQRVLERVHGLNPQTHTCALKRSNERPEGVRVLKVCGCRGLVGEVEGVGIEAYIEGVGVEGAWSRTHALLCP